MVTMSPASAASYAAGAVHLDRLQFRIDHPVFLHVEALVQLAFRDFIVCARVYQVSTTVSLLCHETIHLATDSGSSAKPSLTP